MITHVNRKIITDAGVTNIFTMYIVVRAENMNMLRFDVNVKRRGGFTLIESLVAMSIIGLMVALLLPAIQSARETARRSMCLNNLRQVGLSLSLYHGTNESFPRGRGLSGDPRFIGSRGWCDTFTDKSVLVSLLPYLEQANIYNTINFDLTVHFVENQTIHGLSFSVFTCPSDSRAGARTGYPSYLIDDPSYYTKGAITFFASYSGCHGSMGGVALPDPTLGCNVSKTMAPAANGALTDIVPVSYASISDGLGNTIAVSEKSLSSFTRLDSIFPLNSSLYGYWYSDEPGNTLFDTQYPPNYGKRALLTNLTSQVFSASSEHPGGVNVLLCDGSVRFVKETIQAGIPNVVVSTLEPRAPRGLWQSLGSRNGGEVIDGDGF